MILIIITNMSVIVKTGSAAVPENPSLVFPYETDDFQNHSFNAIESGDHVLVTAHTGSGKTTVAEYAVAYGLSKNMKVIYTAPIKALSNQIFGDFRAKYPQWDIGIKTGDIDYKSENSQVLIMTTEIIRNMLFLDASALKDVGVVIFDEVHWIKDEDRGSVWEESIIMMPDWIQMIMLSATLPDAEDFCKWIASCKGKNVSYTTTVKRVVPLSHYLMTDHAMHLIMENDGTFYDNVYEKVTANQEFIPAKLNKYISRMELPALFFSFSKRNCEKYAKSVTVSLVDSFTANTIAREFDSMLRKFDPSYVGMSQTHEIKNLVSKGIGYHHAGLLPPLKEIVQELFSRGFIQVLFVTETFAAGVNMPAKTVVFTGCSKTNGDGTFRQLFPEEYNQMAGRAGRRGKDTKGTVIILPFNPVRDTLSLDEAHMMMGGQIRSIKSRFKMDCSYVLKTIKSRTDIIKNVNISMMAVQDNIEINKSIKYLERLNLEYEAIGSFNTQVKRIVRFEQAFKAHLLNKKDLKVYNSEIKPWILENKNVYDNALKSMDLESEISSIKKSIEYQKIAYMSDVEYLMIYLKKIGYLNENNEIEIKGCMAIDVNECNPIMLTELVFGNYLDELEFPEIISILALFLLEGGKIDRQPYWSGKAREIKQRFIRDMDEFEKLESQSSPILSDWTTSDYMCDVARLWVGEEMGYSQIMDELELGDLHPGEFVRMMLKLNNLCKEVIKIAAICNKDRLINKLDNHHRLIVRNIVTPQSLYINN